MDIHDKHLNQIGLSNRSANALLRNGLRTVNDLLALSEEELFKIRNLGEKSVAEILEKKQELLQQVDLNQAEDKLLPEIDDFNQWINTDEGKAYLEEFFEAEGTSISELQLLSVKAYNCLMLAGITAVYQLIPFNEEDLLRVPRMDSLTAEATVYSLNKYIRSRKEDILNFIYKPKEEVSSENESPKDIWWYFDNPDYYSLIEEYIKGNDKLISEFNLSYRTSNQLARNGYRNLSDVVFLDIDKLKAMPGLGNKSINEIMSLIHSFINGNASRIIAVCSGDRGALFNDDEIRKSILNLYAENHFAGYSFDEFLAALSLPEEYDAARLKTVIGSLLAEGKLEYVDYRCYRLYPSFNSYLQEMKESIGDRNYQMVSAKLSGRTLEDIAQDYDVTRERVRQIIKRTFEKLQMSSECFDEDYYQYFYKTYLVEKKDLKKWFGLSNETIGYLQLLDIKPGTADLNDAKDDKNLDYGLRIKIRNYLNKDKLFLNDMWIPKKRVSLEELVAREYCQNEVTFDDFINIYNRFLEQNEIPFDESIYITEENKNTARNRLAEAPFILWKQNMKLRYYDTIGRDFSELYDGLGLDTFENTELSTLKLINDHPDLVNKYDIRDQYELHNLLRKTLKEGSYHDFHIQRNPTISFGESDRTKAVYELMSSNAPITQEDLVELLYNEYGYDKGTIVGTIISCIDTYYHQGVYRVDQEKMSDERMAMLSNSLTEDFYFTNEIKDIYLNLFPDAKPEEINPYNLKRMGFMVYSRCALRNQPSLEAYFHTLFTEADIIDLVPLKKYKSIMTFNNFLSDLKRSWEVIEFEPNQLITRAHLEKSGVDESQLKQFCQEVYDFVQPNTYFSIQSIRQNGFYSDLFDLGFSNWFYSNILIADSRFSYGRVFNTFVFYKGDIEITIKAFICELVNHYGSIDIYDLNNELENKYGCSFHDHLDPVYKVEGTPVYYDHFLDRLYATEELYNREIEEQENLQ